MSSTDPSYVPKLKELWGKLSDHIQEEENRDLPALEAKLSPPRASQSQWPRYLAEPRLLYHLGVIQTLVNIRRLKLLWACSQPRSII